MIQIGYIKTYILSTQIAHFAFIQLWFASFKKIQNFSFESISMFLRRTYGQWIRNLSKFLSDLFLLNVIWILIDNFEQKHKKNYIIYSLILKHKRFIQFKIYLWPSTYFSFVFLHSQNYSHDNFLWEILLYFVWHLFGFY